MHGIYIYKDRMVDVLSTGGRVSICANLTPKTVSRIQLWTRMPGGGYRRSHL